MKYIAQILSYSLLIIISGCAEPKIDGPTNPYMGVYIGTETLKGGSTVSAGDYVLKIYINASGKIRIVDDEGMTGYGKIEGDSFRVIRRTPRQIFEGKIVDKTISGVTTENRYTGDGTFSLTLREN